jgi:hypothetical protein
MNARSVLWFETLKEDSNGEEQTYKASNNNNTRAGLTGRLMTVPCEHSNERSGSITVGHILTTRASDKEGRHMVELLIFMTYFGTQFPLAGTQTTTDSKLLSSIGTRTILGTY